MSLSPDKKFGQNFLTNPIICQKIVKLLKNTNSKASHVIEIGPGKGAITEYLLESFKNICLLELDPRMAEHLRSCYNDQINQGDLEILNLSALEFFPDQMNDTFKKSSYSVCGNLPYNVGQNIVFHFFEKFVGASSFCFMLQKEVAEKFKANVGDSAYGPVGVLFTLYCDLGEYFTVKPGSFFPPPKVQSMVFSFTRRKELLNGLKTPFDDPVFYKAFKRFLWSAFQNRRKKLHHKLSFLKGTELGHKRAQDLTPQEYLDVFINSKDSVSF